LDTKGKLSAKSYKSSSIEIMRLYDSNLFCIRTTHLRGANFYKAGRGYFGYFWLPIGYFGYQQMVTLAGYQTFYGSVFFMVPPLPTAPPVTFSRSFFLEKLLIKVTAILW